jgi:hypothetical protein
MRSTTHDIGGTAPLSKAEQRQRYSIVIDAEIVSEAARRAEKS